MWALHGYRMVLVAALIGLGACSKDPADIAAQQARAEAAACRERFAAMPSYLALKDKLPPLEGSPSMALQLNDTKPTAAEVSLLLDFHTAGLAPCRTALINNLAKTDSLLASIVAKNYSNNDRDYVRLMKREISWGAYATAYASERTRYQAEWSAAFEKRYSDEMLRRAVAAPVYQPISTHCTTIGSSVSCTRVRTQ